MINNIPPPSGGESTRLILASGSPRRRELLREAGVSFEVVTASVDELDSRSAPHLCPVDLAQANARLKSEAVAREHPGRWILGADTIVVLGERILGKPASPTQAREFLRDLSGRTHRVITACRLQSPDGSADSFHDESSVMFLPLTDEMIDRYLGAVDVLDKAGAYALQEKGDWIVADVSGSRNNIIGLPMEMLLDRLHRHGLLARKG
jgi:septum formation protein